jgi:hypothetical protein
MNEKNKINMLIETIKFKLCQSAFYEHLNDAQQSELNDILNKFKE